MQWWSPLAGQHGSWTVLRRREEEGLLEDILFHKSHVKFKTWTRASSTSDYHVPHLRAGMTASIRARQRYNWRDWRRDKERDDPVMGMQCVDYEYWAFVKLQLCKSCMKSKYVRLFTRELLYITSTPASAVVDTSYLLCILRHSGVSAVSALKLQFLPTTQGLSPTSTELVI